MLSTVKLYTVCIQSCKHAPGKHLVACCFETDTGIRMITVGHFSHSNFLGSLELACGEVATTPSQHGPSNHIVRLRDASKSLDHWFTRLQQPKTAAAAAAAAAEDCSSSRRRLQQQQKKTAAATEDCSSSSSSSRRLQQQQQKTAAAAAAEDCSSSKRLQQQKKTAAAAEECSSSTEDCCSSSRRLQQKIAAAAAELQQINNFQENLSPTEMIWFDL